MKGSWGGWGVIGLCFRTTFNPLLLSARVHKPSKVCFLWVVKDCVHMQFFSPSNICGMVVRKELWDGSLQCSVFPTVQRNILHKKEQYKYFVLLCVSVEPLRSSQADRSEEIMKHKNPSKKCQKCETGISMFVRCYVMARDSGSPNSDNLFLAQPCFFLPKWTFLQICHCIHAPVTMRQINTLFPRE